MVSHLIDFAVITIFAREVLEGGIIIGEYRTVILRTSDWSSSSSSNHRHHGNVVTQQDALDAVTIAAIGAAALALVVCAAIAIPLAVLSRDFNDSTAIIIEGISKIVAAICILGLSLKMPKFFGLYTSKKNKSQKKNTTNKGRRDDDNNNENEEGNMMMESTTTTTETNNTNDTTNLLSLQSIRFNVAWNIWREVAECGVFLIPFFLQGDNVMIAIPLSAVIGIVVGTVLCLGIYYANQKFSKPLGLTIFTVSLLLMLSTGLFSGGCHKFEMVYGYTRIIWKLNGTFWSVNRLPMTIFKPFGYSDTRTILQMICFWIWLLLGLVLHYRKYCQCRKIENEDEKIDDEVSTKITYEIPPPQPSSSSDVVVLECIEQGGTTTTPSPSLPEVMSGSSSPSTAAASGVNKKHSNKDDDDDDDNENIQISAV